ncbi:hypothetical protein [Pseudoflavonifractor sp. 60]|uniref:hypothetical protein n=1 Tax=Pseudoflavonifractor sp. 60 TaxID=2304576 RepID=UPI00136A7B6D|nr:hypothetical protein [Pseudoflavonifractor sp. 60]
MQKKEKFFEVLAKQSGPEVSASIISGIPIGQQTLGIDVVLAVPVTVAAIRASASK